MLVGFCKSLSYLVMRLIVNMKLQTRDLPVLFYVDGTVVIVVILAVVVRLVTSVVVRRPVHVRVVSAGDRLLH